MLRDGMERIAAPPPAVEVCIINGTSMLVC
jgi:hypothetical protein